MSSRNSLARENKTPKYLPSPSQIYFHKSFTCEGYLTKIQRQNQYIFKGSIKIRRIKVGKELELH